MKTNDNGGHQPSAKVSLSFPKDLLDWIDEQAAKDRRHRSTWIALQMEKMLEAQRALEAERAMEAQRAKEESRPNGVKANKRKSG